MDTTNPAAGTRGQLPDVDLESELEYYIACPDCGQAFDVRDLAEVYHHDEDGHAPLPRH